MSGKSDKIFRRKVLLFHVYVFKDWKSITKRLFANLPFNEVYVNINIDIKYIWQLPFALWWFNQYPKVQRVFVTINNWKIGEVPGFEKLRGAIEGKDYAIVSYMHAKGVTKPQNPYVKDWVELMRYFIADRMDLCEAAFENGYKLYGVNLGRHNSGTERDGPYKYSDFHYSGNFVSINLLLLREKFFSTQVDKDYFGIEGFWGKLCTSGEAFCVHSSINKNHYHEPYPAHLYKVPER